MKLVVIDDEQENRRLLEVFFKSRRPDLELLSFGSAREAIEVVRNESDTALVITDLMMPEISGEQVLKEIKAISPDIPVIIVTGHATVDKAVSLLKAGAYDFVSRPFKREEFMNRVTQALDRFQLGREVEDLRDRLVEEQKAGPIVVGSPAMRTLLGALPAVAQSNAPVLIRGESGTGKELIAREIHRLSPRSRQPFVAINCGAIPEELLESELFGSRKGAYTGAFADKKGVIREARGGTLFLDEIGDMALTHQVKLLRFLQDGEIRPVGESRSLRVDVRVVAATNKALEQAIKDGQFRQDLYYRLNVLPIHLPSLRERKVEIPHLAEHFLKKYSAEEGAKHHTGISPQALQKLMDYDWPGNIRELESVMYRASVVAREGEIGPSDIPLGTEESMQLFSVLEEKPFREAKQEVINRFEANYVARLLKLTQGNVPQAADMAGQDRKSFWRIMTKHRIDPTRFR